MRRIDVAVIGGGPAGCATALALMQHGFSTLVLERSTRTAQPLGETLPPAIQKLLVSLGIWDSFLADGHSPSFGTESAWGRADLLANDSIFNPYGSGWHVDRARFDAMMIRAAQEAGANVFAGAQLSGCEEAKNGGWRIEIAHNNARRQFVADLLVDATGRSASLARKNGARRITFDRLIGIVGLFAARSVATIPPGHTLVEAVEEGWCYSAALPDMRLVLAYMTDADLCASGTHDLTNYFFGKLQTARHTQSRIKHYDLTSKLRIFAANSSRLNFAGGRNWVAVGDAAMAFDPLSSQGIYKAIESGLRVAQSTQEQWTGSSSLEQSFNDYLVTRAAYYAKERRWPNSLFWQRRLVRPADA